MGFLEDFFAKLAKKKLKKEAKQFYVRDILGWAKKKRKSPRPPAPIVLPGDLFLTTSETWPSKIVRWATRSKGEAESRVSHVGMVSTPGGLETAHGIEALRNVTEHGIWEARRRTRAERLAIYRPLNLTEAERQLIVAEARAHVGEKYGWWKLLFHLLAKLTGKVWFKRLLFLDDYPICSYLVGTAFQKAGLTFGVEGRSADPDDIWDFVTTNPEKYFRVRHLDLI